MVKLADLEAGNYWGLIDMRVDYREDGRAIVRIPVSDKHRQVYGQVHGGILASMIDSATAVVINQEIGADQGANTVSLNVSYLRPATGGSLRAEGEIIKTGRTLMVAEARCYDEDSGKLVAHGTATYYRSGRLKPKA